MSRPKNWWNFLLDIFHFMENTKYLKNFFVKLIYLISRVLFWHRLFKIFWPAAVSECHKKMYHQVFYDVLQKYVRNYVKTNWLDLDLKLYYRQDLRNSCHLWKLWHHQWIKHGHLDVAKYELIERNPMELQR